MGLLKILRTIATFSSLLSIVVLNTSAQNGIPVPSGTWTKVLTRGVPEGSNGWEQLVYASGIKQSITLSMYHQHYSEVNESLVGYNFDTNSWDVVDMGGLFHTENVGEGGESQGFFDYNPNNNTIIYHCCLSGSNQPENAFHTWWYDVLGQSGIDKQTSPKPPFSALQPGGAFDPAHNRFVFLGGDSFVGTWTYNPTTNVWQKMSPNGISPNPSLILPGMTYSSFDQKLYLFGGFDGTNFYSDLYTYDVPTNTWTPVVPAGGVKPAGRYRFGFAYDSTNNVILLYGGQNASGILGDTWVFSPATSTWTQLTPPQSPPIAASPVWARLTYDSDHNAFVLAQQGLGGYFGGTWTAYAIQTWLFRYQGAGPNAGTLAPTANAAPGSLNRNAASWAKEPALASSGTTLYATWAETGSPFDPTSAALLNIYAAQYSGSNWIPLGQSFQAISTQQESHAPSMAVSGGNPWISWYQSNDSTSTQVFATQWNGASWQGGTVGLKGTGTAYQGRSQIMDLAGTPHVALLEVDKSYYPQRVFAYVRSWNGTSWPLKGTGPLNRSNVSGTTADSIAITNDGTNPYVAWTEYAHTYGGSSGQDTDTNPQVYVAYWNGTQWTALGGSLNVNTANWAYDASITYLGGQPYVAWTERTQAGNAQLYVKTWNGTSWNLVGGGSLNRAPNIGWAYHPSLVADSASNSLYLAWVEQPSLGQNAQVYVSKCNAGSWTVLGGSLNADTVNGSAQRASLAVSNGQPATAWGEVNTGWLRQIYVKQWNGSAWVQLAGLGGAADTKAPTTPTNLTATAASSTQINLAWSPSTDLVGVVGYHILRGGSRVGDATQTLTYSDTGLNANTSYTYTVAAFDGAGNVSAQSIAATAKTLASNDTTPPVVSMTAPASGTTVSGTITVSANANDNMAMSGVQFTLDGSNVGPFVPGTGPAYSISWNTTTAANGAHSVAAIATDTAGNSTTSSAISVTVNNPPIITVVTASLITSSGATITWKTNSPANSQVAYGLTSSYGSTSALNPTLVTSHSVTLSGLSASTTYHYQVLSQDAQGNMASSGDFTFTTASASGGLSTLLQLHLDATEVSGVTNGSVVTPAVAPGGFTGAVVAKGTGSVNFAAAQTGNGVYFLNCCSNTNNAYYKFGGTTVGNIFNVTQGQVTFYLKSRYSFAQRQSSAASPRYAFDVRDGNGTHLFYFLTQISSAQLQFTYAAGGTAQFYYVPAGTEDTLYGNGVLLQVTVAWNGSVVNLYLNGTLVKSSSYTPSAFNWTAASNFDLGAFEYLSAGGYNSSDDIVDEFTAMGPSIVPDTTPPVVSMTAPANGATVGGVVTVSANATDNVGVASVQFTLDGANLGNPVSGSGPSYSLSWDTTTVVNGSHALAAVASDAAGNMATASSVTVTVSNASTAPVITSVAANSISSTGATITWTTNEAANSQVAYGLTSSYGSTSALNPTLVTSHSVTLSGLSASTTYHYQVLSQDAQGNLTRSGDFTFTTLTTLLLLHGDATEVSGVTNGSVVTPAVAPGGFTGAVVAKGTGSVNFAAA
ncbi:MAG TPA: Ig-like domain-containing protein, partial [Bryobacteraceae bacterium]|nr:Ig-like domain-containing protein [Bryobacteraceae bacterium]